MNGLIEKIAMLVEEAVVEAARAAAEAAATDVAVGITELISGASLEDLGGLGSGGHGGRRAGGKAKTSSARGGKASSKRGGGKRIRRTAEDIQETIDQIVACVRAQGKEGASAEVIRDELGIERKELPKPIAEALKQKLLSKKGKKRGTVYHLAGSVKKAWLSSKKKAKGKKASKKASSKKHAPAKKAARKGGAKSKKASTPAITNGTPSVPAAE